MTALLDGLEARRKASSEATAQALRDYAHEWLVPSAKTSFMAGAYDTILIENAADRLSLNVGAIERMGQYLAPRAYLPPPFDMEALIRGMLEAAKVPETE